ncbi:MAG: hypothetical protein ACP5QK_09620 [Myxococcota bacterium]
MEENLEKSDESKKNESPKEGHIITRSRSGIPLWIWLIIIILILVCFYFLSLINSKRFQICERDGYLIVKKGLFLPYGFAEYIPLNMNEREAYLPLKIPEGERVAKIEVDKGDVDIALFKIISGWIDKYLKQENEEGLKIAAMYMERIMKLNVTPVEYEKYSRLKGELYFRQAKFQFNMGMDMLRQAKEKIGSIKAIAPEFTKESNEIIDKIDRIEKAINPDYSLLEKRDIERLKEEMRKECITTCVRESIEKSSSERPNESPSTDPAVIPSTEPVKSDGK